MRSLLIIIIVILAAALLLYRARRPGDLLIRMLLTIPVFLYLRLLVVPLIQSGRETAILAVPAAALAGLLLSAIWAGRFLDNLAERFTNFLFGENQQIDPQPMYSPVEALIKRGRYSEAELRLRSILSQFPGDYRATVMLADLLFERQQRHEEAIALLEAWIQANPDRINETASILNQLADMAAKKGELSLADSYLEQIELRFPESEAAILAHQRRLRLQYSLQHQQAQGSVTRAYKPRPWLPTMLKPSPQAQQQTIAEKIQRLIHQLDLYPDDWAAREELAAIYAAELHRPDLACEQIELLTKAQNIPAPRRARYLQLLAEYALKSGDIERARQALTVLIETFPASPFAEVAQRHLAMISERKPSF